MTYEFECPAEHITEVFFRSISAAEGIEVAVCAECGEEASRIISRPMEAHLYGDTPGFNKPSPTKRHSTKIVNAKTGNRDACG